jgi:ATP-dependent Clp protease protease subunit
MLALRDRLDEILAEHTGKPKDQIHEDTERDKILSADEAVEYGLVDRVMRRRKPSDDD